jgi:phage protein D
MAIPRNMVITVTVNGATANISDDIEEFTYTETLENEAHTCDIKVRDTDLKYRNKWFIKKGSQIVVQVSQKEWTGAGDNFSRGTDTMWIDTIDLTLKPRSMQFKATSVNPAMEKGGVKHTGTEGTKLSAKMAKDAAGDFLPATPEAPDASLKRIDTEAESDLRAAKRLAKENDQRTMVVGGKVITFRECDMEAKAVSFIFHDDATEKDSPFLGGKMKTTCQDKVKGGKHQYIDPKTGKLITTTVTLPNPPDGTNTIHNSRKRPPLTGNDDQYEAYSYSAGMQPNVPGGGNPPPPDPEYVGQ